MAILIPSKNIYQPTNDKILKNVIERIEINATDIVPNNEFETSVYNEKFAPKDGGVRDNFDVDYKIGIRETAQGTITDTYYSCSYLYEEYYYHKATIKVDRNLKNKYVSKLYYGLEEIEGTKKERDFVKYSVTGTTKTTPIEITIHKRSATTSLEDSETTISKGTPNESIGYINIPKLPIEVTITNTNLLPNIVSKVVGVNDASNYVVVTENEDYYEVSVEFLSSFYIRKATGTLDVDGKPSDAVDIVMKGEEVEATANEISITVYGNTIGIDLQNKSITISEEGKENSKKVFPVSNNELLQTSNYVSGTNANAIEENYRNTLNAYKNGRETATLLCDINEYKDTNGNLAISTKQEGLPMTFNVGNEVIPMVFSANGEDVPMSQKDGLPKVFVVSSVKPYYDGAVWQQIEIQEKTS